jgi:L-amino acid N-acyltransferase
MLTRCFWNWEKTAASSIQENFMHATPAHIRPATPADLEAINRIYNHCVDHSTCTYAEQHSTAREREAWFKAHDAAHPVTVADRGGQVVGWGSLSVFVPRSGYRFTVENSIYVAHDSRRQGIGSLILADLIERARSAGHHCIVAGVDGEQTASLSLHAKFNFKKVAHLAQVGCKFGRWLDTIYMQLML